MSIVGNEIKRLGLMSMYEFLDKDPEENLPKLVDWLDSYIDPEVLKPQRQLFRVIIEKKDSNWYRLLVSLWSDIDDDVRKTLFENLVINANALAAETAGKSRKKYGCNIPWVILITLDEENGLDFDAWDDVIEQAKQLGTFAFMFQGKDMLRNKEEMIALCNKHAECEFMVCTDGRHLDDDYASQILRVKNLIVALNVTGTEADRGLDAPTEMLRKYKLPYAAVVRMTGRIRNASQENHSLTAWLVTASSWCFSCPLCRRKEIRSGRKYANSERPSRSCPLISARTES